MSQASKFIKNAIIQLLKSFKRLHDYEFPILDDGNEIIRQEIITTLGGKYNE